MTLGSQEGTGCPEAKVSQGGGNGQLGQEPPAGQEDLAACRSLCPLQRIIERWRSLFGKGSGKNVERGLEKAVLGSRGKGEPEGKWGYKMGKWK